MDKILEELIQSCVEIPKEKRKEIQKIIAHTISKSLKKLKDDIMFTLVTEASKKSTIYDAVVQINKLYENEKK